MTLHMTLSTSLPQSDVTNHSIPNFPIRAGSKATTMASPSRIGNRRGTTQNRKIPVAALLWTPVVGIFVLIMVSFHAHLHERTVTTESIPLPQSHTADAVDVRSINDRKQLAKNDNNPNKAVTVAYAISLIKCGDKQSNIAGLTDAALVLRHSVHMASVRNPKSGSKYDYKMYAIVHKQAERCSQALVDAGFELIIKDQPVQPKEIKGKLLREKIHREWCCGAAEFVKLYAYLIDAPIVVHTDIDFIYHQPMDNLFDAMLYDKDSPEGKAARSMIEVERPDDPWPDKVEAFMTRDWPQVMPGRKPPYQAGFIALKPNKQVFDSILKVIRKGDYKEGFGRDNGWGGKGYGAFVGAMAMQGLLAYVYDEIFPGTWVELNQCRYNHMGLDVLYRGQPSFQPNHPKVGQCRNDRDYCEDCMTTELSKIYNIHYTHCRKPWNCIGEISTNKSDQAYNIPKTTVNYDHCMEIMTVWHSVRSDLEKKLFDLTKDKSILDGQKGKYKRQVFGGHCNGNGGNEYLVLQGKRESYQRLHEIYDQ